MKILDIEANRGTSPCVVMSRLTCLAQYPVFRHEPQGDNSDYRNMLSQKFLSQIFFEQQLNQEASYMAAFTAKGPSNKEAFTAHWHRILADETVVIKTIIFKCVTG